MKLKVLSNYKNGQTVYKKDDNIEVTEAEADFLFRDSPESFEAFVAEPAPKKKKKAPAKPPADKAVKSETANKK